MTDSRLVDYFLKNRGRFPLESIKKNLLQQGFQAEEIEKAAHLAEKRTTAAAASAPQDEAVVDIAPPGGQEPPAVGNASFHPQDLPSNAWLLYFHPRSFFASLNPDSSCASAMPHIFFCSLLSGALKVIVGFSVTPAIDPFLNNLSVTASLILVCSFAALMLPWSFVLAGVFHFLCGILGGTGGYRASYQVVAGIFMFIPVSAILSQMPFQTALTQLYVTYLIIQAAIGTQHVSQWKAWCGFGLIGTAGAALLFLRKDLPNFIR